MTRLTRNNQLGGLIKCEDAVLIAMDCLHSMSDFSHIVNSLRNLPRIGTCIECKSWVKGNCEEFPICPAPDHFCSLWQESKN